MLRKITEKNKKTLSVVLVTILVVTILLSALVYFQSLNEQEQAAPYTVIGTLTYAPWHAVTPGVSITSVSPSLSPSPNALTWTEPKPPGQSGSYNYTVDAFVFVSFKNNFTLPQGIGGFPTGFESGDEVKLTGEIKNSAIQQGYYDMNVTSISHYGP